MLVHVHGSMRKCIKKSGHFALASIEAYKCLVFFSRGLILPVVHYVRGAVEARRPRGARIDRHVFEQIEGEISPGAAASTALLSCSIDDRGRLRPRPRSAAEESLPGGTGLRGWRLLKHASARPRVPRPYFLCSTARSI